MACCAILLSVSQLLIVSIFCLDVSTSLPIGIPPGIDRVRYNKTRVAGLLTSRWPGFNSSEQLKCTVSPTDKGVHHTITNLLVTAKLIEYQFNVKGYATNPLAVNNTWSYKTNFWSRIASSHGQVILNLAFNYGILSLMTLRFGTVDMTVELQDEPPGCLGVANEDEKIMTMLHLVLRDLDPSGDVVVTEGESSVCHQWILEENGRAKFTDRCCYETDDGDYVECVVDIPNRWLRILDILLGALTVCVFVFGPMMLPAWVYTAALDTEKYFVKLKEPLYKKLVICRRSSIPDIKATHVLDFRNRQDFSRARKIITQLPSEVIIPVKFSQFDINVNYKKLLCENKVNVGMLDSISRAIFLCKLREIDAFADCCDSKIFGCCSKNSEDDGLKKSDSDSGKWISVCNVVGRLLLVIFLPSAFYVRLIVYYLFEDPEIQARQEAADNIGLPVYYNYRIMQYLTPVHPMYLAVYIIYFIAGIATAYYSGVEKKTRFQQAIMDAFADMESLSMLKALGMLIHNCLWPFSKYGIFGIFFGLLVWPLLLPVSLVLFFIYCLPTVFLTCRIILHAIMSADNVEPEERRLLRPAPENFHATNVVKRLRSIRGRHRVQECWSYCTPRIGRVIKNGFLALSAIVTLYAIMVMLAEVTSFLVEVMCFTMMGIIVNASAVLKYGSLLFLVVLYSYDTYNNVTKKYSKLNKALFSEIKNRLGKDIDQYTQLPSVIQKNRGFKAAEASDQAEYECIDDISTRNRFHWTINDLILFIDQEDFPRIPKKLFDEVCQVKVAGSPGPIYLSLIDATKKFLIIVMFLLFVFIVVLSFGESYKVSQTNQMLATMAGGFMPFMFRNIFKPGKAEVETSLLSFRSKLEEIVKNYCQDWPMYDMTFEVEDEPQSDEEEDEEKNSEGKDTNDKTSGDKHHKKDSKASWLADMMPMTSQNLSTLDLRETVDNMDLPPAEGQEVDLLVYVTELDHDWTYELSSYSDLHGSDVFLGMDCYNNGARGKRTQDLPVIKINGTVHHASESDTHNIGRQPSSPGHSRRNSKTDLTLLTVV